MYLLNMIWEALLVIRFYVNTVVNPNYLQPCVVYRTLPYAHAQNQRVAIDGPEWDRELNDNYRGLIESVINQCGDRQPGNEPRNEERMRRRSHRI